MKKQRIFNLEFIQMTKKFVKSIDKDICQCYSNDDKKSCQRSNEYAIIKSVKRTSF